MIASCFFFNHPATTDIYTLSLHDALPILRFAGKKLIVRADDIRLPGTFQIALGLIDIRLRKHRAHILQAQVVERSEEHTSELQSLRHLVCRLLLEKKKTSTSPSAPPAKSH